jgi:uracil-DNA glycosylase
MRIKPQTQSASTYRANCRDCPRLCRFLVETRGGYPDYFCKPVPAFGVAKPRLLIVGLAPGLHGANRTGRPFTGDASGDWLFRALYKYGFANRPDALRKGDGIKLKDCRITNAVKCLPPSNKPSTLEIRTCNRYLRAELAETPRRGVILALGGVAHAAVLLATGSSRVAHKFGHAARHKLETGRILFDSYHCSRYNTNTGRLSENAFHEVFAAIRSHLDA